MRNLKAMLASSHFSPARSGPRPRTPLRAKALAAVVPVALLGAFAVAPSGAMAAEEPCVNNVLCDNAGNALRDDGVAPEGFGTDAMASNTQGTLRLQAVIGETVIASNQNPANYAYFGLELESNPETSCQAGKEEAEGSVTFADIQNAQESEVFAGISPGGFGPWPITVRSNHCEEDPGKVRVKNVHLLFPGLNNAVAEGEFTGTYVQPNATTCEGGGLELDINQPNVTVAGVATARIDDGAGEPALLCFVSANNYVFPTEAPEWEPLTGAIWKD